MRVCPRCGAVYITDVQWCGIDGETLVATEDDPLVGSAIERYEILERLGMGGMGCVYAAKHAVIDRHYAIKVLFGDYAGDEKFRARFKREAQSISKIRHPNIVQVEDFGTASNGLTFLAMELVRGRTLEEVIATEAPLSPTRTAQIVRQIAAGLHAAHQLGFVHRDVKPSNIMLMKDETYDGELVKILDFGAVSLRELPMNERLTSIGHIIGTPAYMAPEQTQDPGVGPTADIYSLGCVTFEMLAGHPPFDGKTRAEVMVKHILEAAPNAPPSRGLELLCRRLLAKHPQERPQSCAAVVQAIDALDLGLPPLPDGARPRIVSMANGLAEATIERDAFHSAPTNHMILGNDADLAAERAAAEVREEIGADAFPVLDPAEPESPEWGASWNSSSAVPYEHDDQGATGPSPVHSTLIVRERETARDVDTSDLVVPDVAQDDVTTGDVDAVDVDTDPSGPLEDVLFEPARPSPTTKTPAPDDGPTQVDFHMDLDIDARPEHLPVTSDDIVPLVDLQSRPPLVATVGDELDVLVSSSKSVDSSGVETEPPMDTQIDTHDDDELHASSTPTFPVGLEAPLRPRTPVRLLPEASDVPDTSLTVQQSETLRFAELGTSPRAPDTRLPVQRRTDDDKLPTVDGAAAIERPTSSTAKSAFYSVAIVLLLVAIALLGSLLFLRAKDDHEKSAAVPTLEKREINRAP